MRHVLAAFIVVGSTLAALSGQPLAPPPIIDMHLHASKADSQGPPPLGFCTGTPFPVGEPGTPWSETFTHWYKHPPCANPIWSPMTDHDLLDRTLAALKRRNVYALTSGNGALLQTWQQAGSERIIPSLSFSIGPNAPAIDVVRGDFQAGRYKAMGEITNQYQGIEPGDPRFEPYLALAEALDVPVGIHLGTGPPGAPYLGSKNYRARLHSALLIEEPLYKHPKLRLYLMHAGWPMLDDLLAVMWTHPQVYVDTGIIAYGLPPAAFHSYLQRIVEAGFGKRVMFGSDQMVWPEAVERAIDAIESAPFLSPEQKRDILYDNAVRFLRISATEQAKHRSPS